MMKPKKEALDIATLYNRWLNECERIKSPCTVRAFTITINNYIDFLTDVQGFKTKSFSLGKCFSRAMIEKWLCWLEKKKKCSPQSCNVRLSNLRSFLKYLSVENYKYMEIYLASTSIEQRKTTKVKIRGVSKEAIEALLNSIDTSTEVGLRDCVLWQTVYLTGMRISEALSIKLKDLNLKAKDPCVTFVGKRRNIRTSYLPSVLVENLNYYISRTFDEKYDGETFLFFSRQKGIKEPMTIKNAEMRLRKNASIANKKCKDVPLDLRPHMLRHSFATHRLDDGANVIQVSELLGHKDISTTMRYLDISYNQTKEAMIGLESEEIRKIEPKWNIEDMELSKLFKRKVK